MRFEYLFRLAIALPILGYAVPVHAQTDGNSLNSQVQAEISGFSGRVWIYAQNLDSGATYDRGADERVRTASTIKLPIMVAVFQSVQEGALGWGERLEVREGNRVSGSGVVREMSDGLRIPLRDLVRLMIVVSDNTATNMVLDRISPDYVNSTMRRLGLPGTLSMRKIRGDGNDLKAPQGWSEAGRLQENQRFGIGSSTSREMVSLLAMLEAGKVVSPAESKEMLEILKRQQYGDGIPRLLPAGTVVANKTGALDALRSDVGIVYSPRGRIAMAITVDDMPQVLYTPDNPGLLLIARLARLLVDGLGK